MHDDFYCEGLREIQYRYSVTCVLLQSENSEGTSVMYQATVTKGKEGLVYTETGIYELSTDTETDVALKTVTTKAT